VDQTAWRLIIDENVPAAMTTFLVERGHEVLNLRTMFGVGMADEEIAAFGDWRDGVVVTWDRDFKTLVSRVSIGGRAQFRRLGRISFDGAPSKEIHRIRSLIRGIEFAYNDSLAQKDSRFIVDISETRLRLIRWKARA